MTKTELSQLYWLNKETAQLQKDLAELRQKDMYHSPTISDMPKGSCKQDRTGDHIAELMILEDMIKLNMQKIYLERTRLEKYIADIPDSETRLIMRLRHINGMTFEQIGGEIGMDRRTASRKHESYLKVAHNAR